MYVCTRMTSITIIFGCLQLMRGLPDMVRGRGWDGEEAGAVSAKLF